MIQQEDILIIITGLSAFIFFLVLHFIGFRFLKPEQLFKGIIGVFFLGFLFCAVLAFNIFTNQDTVHRLGLTILALTIYVLASFVYVLCFFGPYETSIRMRLIRELSTSKNGLTMQELLSRYNTAVILDHRFKRLLGGGDLAQKGKLFYIRKKNNAFFIIDAIAQKLNAFINGR
jgi:hypothetical protein